VVRELLRQAPLAQVALVAVVIIGLIGTGATIAQMALLSQIVDWVFLGHRGFAQAHPALALLLGVIVVRASLLWVREAVAQEAALRVKSALRARLFAHLLRLGPAYVQGERTGELAATALEGVERLDAYVGRYLPQIALSAGAPLLIVVYILPLDWASAVLLLVTGPIIPLLMILVGSYAQQHIDRQWTALARMSAHFLDAVQGVTTLTLFGRAGAERARIARVSDEVRVRTMAVLRYAFLSGMVLELMSAVAIALVAVTLGVRLLDGGIGFARAFLVLLLAPEFYRPLRDLGTYHHAGMEGKAAAGRIMEILRTPAPLQTQGSASSPRPPAGMLTMALTGVSYTYPGGARPALAGVTLTLEAGTRTALVGRSGAGKSSLANLLLRFIDPQGGDITANGIPLAALPPETWRALVALVPQRPYLFYGTVRDNIRLVRPDASDADVARAAELAGAAEFIGHLPRGYETPVGERGARLSAGQAQRIAIARAFLKDAPLLILDEPTSSLDPESEAHVQRALERLMRDRTVLVIAHRLATIDHSDQIAVLESGQLVEVGRHAALLRCGGPYARLMGAYHEIAVPV